MRASLGSVREKIRSVARGVPRDFLSLVPVSLAAIDDNIVVVAANAVARWLSARAQMNAPAKNLHSNSGTVLRSHQPLFCSKILDFESRSLCCDHSYNFFLSRFLSLPFLLAFGKTPIGVLST